MVFPRRPPSLDVLPARSLPRVRPAAFVHRTNGRLSQGSVDSSIRGRGPDPARRGVRRRAARAGRKGYQKTRRGTARCVLSPALQAAKPGWR